MCEINKKGPMEIQDFAVDGKDPNDKFNRLCFDIINFFERVDGDDEVQKFISNLMSLSSSEMDYNLTKSFIMLHNHFEFSLYKKNTVIRDSAINTVKNISILINKPRRKIESLVIIEVATYS